MSKQIVTKYFTFIFVLQGKFLKYIEAKFAISYQTIERFCIFLNIFDLYIIGSDAWYQISNKYLMPPLLVFIVFSQEKSVR